MTLRFRDSEIVFRHGSKRTDRDLMSYALKAGYGRKGAKIGGRDGESELFRADMLAFWQRTLG
jgi:hypothetical protein